MLSNTGMINKKIEFKSSMINWHHTSNLNKKKCNS